jgi:DNA-binding HxlR family transcriptional regulator
MAVSIATSTHSLMKNSSSHMNFPQSDDGRIRNCSVERTLAILSDAWTFLVLREFYMGAHRFDQIQSVLGIPRSTLSDRLNVLTNADVIKRIPSPKVEGRTEYRLTERGLELYRVMLTLMRFGDEHMRGDAPPPLQLVHKTCGHVCQPVSVCSSCNEPVDALRVRFRDGPGAGQSNPTDQMQRRRRGNADTFERGRPSSVSRTLSIIADRWSFLILRELFFGGRRYDEFRERLGISPSTLAERLSRLVSTGILDRVKYQEQPVRYEYRLSRKGRDLYQPLIQMLHWGDRWLGFPPPLVLTHLDCGDDFHPNVVCNHCHGIIDARDISYRLNYAPPNTGPHPEALLKVE